MITQVCLISSSIVLSLMACVSLSTGIILDSIDINSIVADGNIVAVVGNDLIIVMWCLC
jgi:hypothetical protein